MLKLKVFAFLKVNNLQVMQSLLRVVVLNLSLSEEIEKNLPD
jgi:hypothetical protein